MASYVHVCRAATSCADTDSWIIHKLKCHWNIQSRRSRVVIYKVIIWLTTVQCQMGMWRSLYSVHIMHLKFFQIRDYRETTETTVTVWSFNTSWFSYVCKSHAVHFQCMGAICWEMLMVKTMSESSKEHDVNVYASMSAVLLLLIAVFHLLSWIISHSQCYFYMEFEVHMHCHYNVLARIFLASRSSCMEIFASLQLNSLVLGCGLVLILEPCCKPIHASHTSSK